MGSPFPTFHTKCPLVFQSFASTLSGIKLLLYLELITNLRMQEERFKIDLADNLLKI